MPTVTDRLIQQAISQTLSKEYDITFSGHSYGFRPNRSAHDAVRKAKGYLKEGFRWDIDVDLEKFFDKVNHDRLMATLAKQISEKSLLKLIRKYLQAGIEKLNQYLTGWCGYYALGYLKMLDSLIKRKLRM